MDINWNITSLDHVDSTNRFLVDKIESEKHILEGFGVQALYQTGGKGQRGNTWESEKNKNLLLSIILKPGLPIERQFLLSQIISLAIADYLVEKEEIIDPIRIKWPNDIYIGDHKIAGILIQNFVHGKLIKNSIVGIGLNLNQKVFLSSAPNPISLSQISNINYDIQIEMFKLLEKINMYYKELFKIRKAKPQNMYRFLLYRLDETHEYLDANGVKFSGKIKGVDDLGRLKIERYHGLEHFNLYELKYIL